MMGDDGWDEPRRVRNDGRRCSMKASKSDVEATWSGQESQTTSRALLLVVYAVGRSRAEVEDGGNPP